MAAQRASEMKGGSGPDSDTFAHAIDLVHLSKQTMGDATLEAELLRLFDRQTRNILAQLEAELAARRRSDLAHTLKGSARAIGAFLVADAAERLETAHPTSVAERERLLCELKCAVRRAQADIAALLQ